MIDACFGFFALCLVAVVVSQIINALRADRRLSRLRDCTDELCRLTGRRDQIDRAERFGVDVETRARMYDEWCRDHDATIARHRREFPEIDND